ncbi:hypothetical protein GCM10020331_010850 [Ectobacillus funiculus]
MFGKNGFQTILKQVEQLEKALDIYELSQYTPHFTKINTCVSAGVLSFNDKGS